MIRLACVASLASFVLANSAWAIDGVTCGRGGCQTQTLKPGCKVVQITKGRSEVVCEQRAK